MIKSRYWFSMMIGATAAIAVGCNNDGPQADQTTVDPVADEEQVVNLYSSRHYDTDRELYNQFTEQTGIDINLIEGSDDELIERIRSEGENTQADVLITVDVGRLWRAEEAGILQPIDSEELTNAVPANLRDEQGHWYGLTRRARVIVYNPDTVQPNQINSYEDLADPQWQGRVCVRSSENIYNQSLVAAMIETKGEEATQEWVEGFVNNFAREPQGNDTDQIKAVAAGTCDVALVNHYYVARLKASEDSQDQQIAENVGVIFPDLNQSGTHINISGAGVVEGAPHPQNAVQFIEFLATPEAQEIFANNNNEYPVIAELEPNETVASFGEFEASNLDIAAYGENNADAVVIMDQGGWR